MELSLDWVLEWGELRTWAGMNIESCRFECMNSPGHGIYLSGGDYNAQQPYDIRIANK